SHELDRLRQEVDEVNVKLLELLSKRAELAQAIGEVKKAQGIHRFDPERERDMLNWVSEANPGPFDDKTIRHLFKQIFKASLDLQQKDNKKALLLSRKRKPEDTVVHVRNLPISNDKITGMPVPYSLSSKEQLR